MPDLNQFVNEFQFGFQRHNRYRVSVHLQPSLVASIIAANRDTGVGTYKVVKWLYSGMLADTARLPDRGFSVVPLSMYGITENFPYFATYSPLAVAFIMPHQPHGDGLDSVVSRFFSDWQNQIQNMQTGPSSGMNFSFPAEYYATITIAILDLQDEPTSVYSFANAYPFTVDTVPLGWGEEGFSHLPVQFHYSYWTLLPAGAQ